MQTLKGFTIIELLMVIAIITILPVIVLSNFPQAKLQFALSRAAHAFAQDARLAQDMAKSSLPYKDSFGISQLVGGYGVYVDIDRLGNKKYIMYADALPANSQYDPADYMVKSVDIGLSEPGVIIKDVRNVFLQKASINFAIPGAEVSVSRPEKRHESLEIIFALEKTLQKTKSIFIHPSGLVEVQ